MDMTVCALCGMDRHVRHKLGVMICSAAAYFHLLCGVLLWLLPWSSGYAELRVLDDNGQPVVVDRPAGRIVSLAPHITELLFAVGAGDAVVGASEYSDYPAAARAIPQVGGGSGLDLEAILALRPELVVAWGSGSPPGQLQRLRRLGIPVFVSEPQVMTDIASSLERLGRLAGHETGAAQAIRQFNQRFGKLRDRYAARAPVRVFYQVWQQPLMTISGDHLVSDVIRLCGGSNIFADLAELAPPVSVESVLARNPEVIIAGSDAAENPELAAYWQRWTGMSAVQKGHVYTVQRELLVRHTPRILDGAEQVCRILEAVRDPPRDSYGQSAN
jgi:iron complex transport system substrate-binding protein